MANQPAQEVSRAVVSTCTEPHRPHVHYVGICGRARVGKSTTASLLVDEFGYDRVSFATALKATFAAVCFESDATFKEEMKPLVCPHTGVTYARMLQMLVQCVRREFGTDFWVKVLFARCEAMAAERGCRWFVIEDVRFPPEADEIHRRGGVIVHLKRPGVVLNDGRNANEEDITESIQCDYVIENDGTMQQLKEKVLVLGELIKRSM